MDTKREKAKTHKVLLLGGFLRWVCWIFSCSPSFSMHIAFFFCYLRFWLAHLITANIVCTWVLLIFGLFNMLIIIISVTVLCSIIWTLWRSVSLGFIWKFGCRFFCLFQYACLPPTNLSPLERNVKCSFHRFIFVFFSSCSIFLSSSSVFCGFSRCIASCVSPTDEIRDWLLDIWLS